MKFAKNRRNCVSKRLADLSRFARKPVYRLDELLAQMPPRPFDLDEEMRAWENMAPVGKEVI